jgi:RNA polymerase sigma-70 factor (ECF subfamily)
MSELPDEVLMSRIQQQDEQALALLIDRHLVTLHAFARRMLGNGADAEDIVQEAFLRVWYRSETWTPGQAKLSTWLHRIVHNLCIDLHRHRKGERMNINIETIQDELATPMNTPEEDFVAAQTSQQVERALQELPEKQRSAIILCHYQGMSNRQAATVLNVSVTALESLMARGRKMLREKLAV